MSKVVLFMGDSITDCKRDREDCESLGSGYAAFTAGSLAAKDPGEYSFINRGIAGNRVCDLVSRMDADIISHKPDYMSILTGANDLSSTYIRYGGARCDRYKKLYSLLIEESLAELPDLKIFILTPFLLPHKQLEKTYEGCPHFNINDLCAGMDELVETTVGIAKKYSLPCVNLHQKFKEAQKLAPVEYWSRDGYHPSVAGHGLIAREWRKLFDEVR